MVLRNYSQQLKLIHQQSLRKISMQSEQFLAQLPSRANTTKLLNQILSALVKMQSFMIYVFNYAKHNYIPLVLHIFFHFSAKIKSIQFTSRKNLSKTHAGNCTPRDYMFFSSPSIFFSANLITMQIVN